MAITQNVHLELLRYNPSPQMSNLPNFKEISAFNIVKKKTKREAIKIVSLM